LKNVIEEEIKVCYNKENKQNILEGAAGVVLIFFIPTKNLKGDKI
jgi:hypothetical protein